MHGMKAATRNHLKPIFSVPQPMTAQRKFTRIRSLHRTSHRQHQNQWGEEGRQLTLPGWKITAVDLPLAGEVSTQVRPSRRGPSHPRALGPAHPAGSACARPSATPAPGCQGLLGLHLNLRPPTSDPRPAPQPRPRKPSRLTRKGAAHLTSSEPSPRAASRAPLTCQHSSPESGPPLMPTPSACSCSSSAGRLGHPWGGGAEPR